MVGRADFPDCCGIIILNQFKGGHPHSDPEDCISTQDCNTFLQTNEREFYDQRACLMAVLSQPQNNKLQEVFRSRRWELIKEINNPRTGVKIHIWIRDLNHTESRKKRIFRGT